MFLKSPSPSASEWVKEIPDLESVNGIGSWVDICRYLDIDPSGNSARRALKMWVEKNKPDWFPVPEV